MTQASPAVTVRHILVVLCFGDTIVTSVSVPYSEVSPWLFPGGENGTLGTPGEA